MQETTQVQATPGGQIETHTVTSKSSDSEFFTSKANQIIFSLVAIINILILLRFTFLLLGANRVGIVNFIMNLTSVFVAPFRGIFDSPSDGSSYFDMASVVAILIWSLFAFILTIVVKMFSTETE